MTTNDMPRWATAFVLPILNLLSALLVAALVIHLLGEDPVESMRILINSAVVNPEGLSYTLFYASTFIFTGLAVSIAMQAGLFNIGAEGQMYFGGLGLTLAMLAPTAPIALAMLFVPLMLTVAYVGPTFSAVHAMMPEHMRALAISLLIGALTLIGASAGPPLVGLVSDLLAARYFGDPLVSWRIADANGRGLPEELTRIPGTRLRIAVPDGIG